jgi:hypothetical protein
MAIPTSSSRKPGRPFLAAVLVAAGILFLIVWLSGDRPQPRAVRPTEAEPAAPPPPPAVMPTLAGLPAAAAPEEEATPDAPIIDEILVEKSEVCEGEENLITVKAHTPSGRDDAFLHYLVGTSPGRAVPVRAYLPPAGSETPGPMQIQVFGRRNVVTAVPLPSYTIKRCRPERLLFLQSRQMPNSIDELELVATVRELGPTPPLRVTSYRWSFGDKSNKVVTAGPSAIHRFAPQNPDTLYSDYLVTCEAVGGDGRTVVGRTALSLRNTEFENLHFQKTLVLSVALTPRFPERDSRGRVVQSARLYHHRGAPVRLTRARVTYVEGDDQVAPPAEERPAGEVLGTEEIPPGHGVERRFSFDPAAHPGARMVDYAFEGQTADGIPVIAGFSLMVPPPAPTQESGAQVVDAQLRQKVLRARERLGKPFVNDEDLTQLEREGAFADLQPSPATATVDQAPAVAKPSPRQLEAAIAAKRLGR